MCPTVDARLQALLVQRLAEDASDALARHAIPTMPLKGAHLVRWVYANPGDRPSADMDLLVPVDQFTSAVDVLASLGFTVIARTRQAWTLSSPHYPIPLDLHRNLAPYGMFSFDLERVFARALRPDSHQPTQCVMERHDLFVHLCTHFAVSRFDARHRMALRDLSEVARKSPLDLGRLRDRIAEAGAARAVRYTLSIAVDVAKDSNLLEILDQLPTDAIGGLVERVSTHWLPLKASRRSTVLSSHFLDRSLGWGAISFCCHLWEAAVTQRRDF